MQRFLLLHVPSPVLGLLFLVVVVGLSLGAMWMVRRSTKVESLESHKDVAGFIIAVIGGLYSVLLAFIVVTVWESFEAAEAVAEREAGVVTALYRDADVFPAHGADIRTNLRAYALSVAEQEWRSMAEDQGEADQTDTALAGIFDAYRSVAAAIPIEEIFLDHSIDRLDDVTEARRGRIAAASTELPGPLWVVLLIGGAITIGFTLFLPVRSRRAQGLMVASLASMTALTLFLIASLDLPYTGDLAVKPTAMRDAIAEFDHLDRE